MPLTELIKKIPLFKLFLKQRLLTKQLKTSQQQLALAVATLTRLGAKQLDCSVKEPNLTAPIVSVTSYGERVLTVHLTMQSLLLQTAQTKKVILWLASDEFNLVNLPKELLALQQYGLEISFCSDIRSYKKLIPTLIKYPDDTIITFDDDVIYPEDHVARLLATHQQHPNDIICHRAHRVMKDKKGKLKPYMQWQFDVCNEDSITVGGKDILAVGIGGVLYPKNCFDKEVLNEDVFILLAPYADDIWFKVMAMKQGTSIRIVGSPTPYQEYLFAPNSQESSLWQHNKEQNDQQLMALLKYYPEIKF